MTSSVEDPGFPVGERGRQPRMQALFGENVCQNEKIGSCWGRGLLRQHSLDPPLIDTFVIKESNLFRVPTFSD